MKSSPTVSVVMTVYNHEQFVGEAVASILNQTVRDIELIIVDDGSQDGTLEVLREWETDQRVTVIPQKKIGRGRALNLAIEHARGEFVAIMDADDFSVPDRLEVQLAYLRQHPEIGALGGQKRLIYRGHVSERKHSVPLTDGELRRILPRRNTMIHISVMMPRAVLQDVGSYDPSLPVALDYDLWVRIAARYRLANLPKVLVIERDHSSAHFRNVAVWTRIRTLTGIRWRAWRQFSRNPLDLWFVVDPIEMLQLFVKHKCPRLRHLYYILTRHPSVAPTHAMQSANGDAVGSNRAGLPDVVDAGKASRRTSAGGWIS